MHLKIVISATILIIFAGIYTVLGLPVATESSLYPYIVGYMPLIRKVLQVLMLLTSAFLGGQIMDFIIIKSFASTIRGNPLAKKLFPLIEWAITILIWIVAIFFMLGVIGVNISALITGAGVGGIFFALASKEFVSNLFGSLSLIFSRNFKIGDTIRVKGYEGLVEEISLSYTKLTDKRGTVIFMPNKLIVSETIENLSMSPTKKAEFTIEIPVASPQEVREFLESIENDIKELGHKGVAIYSSIDGITENGYTATIRVEMPDGDMSAVKKEVWMLLRQKTTIQK